jgi:hypothetical protein
VTQSTPKGAFEGADETKMLVTRFELGLHLKVVEVLEALQAPGYTVCEDLKGMGCTGRKDGNPIWPGNTVVVQTCVEDGMVAGVVERVRAARDEYVKRPGCAVFAVPAEKLR